MARKKDDMVEDQTDETANPNTADNGGEPVPDFGNRPEIGDGETPDMETLAHNWQSGSPAVDMRDVSKPLANQDNLVQRLEREANQEKEEADTADKPVLTADEHKARTKLDVSDPEYVNPSLDHHEVVDNSTVSKYGDK